MRLTIHKDVAPEDWSFCARIAARFVAEYPEPHRGCAYSTDDFGTTVFVDRTRSGGVSVCLQRKKPEGPRP